MPSPAIHVGIELSRDIRLGKDGLLSPATREVGGVNLLRHAIKTALQVAPADNIQVLAVDTDSALLDIINEFSVREGGAMQWIGGLVDRAANAGPGDAVIILRQMVPLRDSKGIKDALALLKQRCVVSADSKGVCRAFEVWRLSEFSKYAFAGAVSEKDKPLVIPDDAFVDIHRPEDEPRAAKLLKG